MRTMTRRSFVQAAALAAAATRLRAATGGGFRIFACDWTLKLTSDPGSFVLAKKIGLDGVQVDFGRPAAGATSLPLLDPAHQDRILAAAAENGVAVASVALGVLNSVAFKSEAIAEEWVAASVGAMTRMKQKVALLAFFSKGDLVDDEPGIAETIKRLKKLAPRAEAAGLTYGIESWLKVPVLERILDAVKSPAIQVYYDVGNMQKVGEDVGAAIRRLGRERICEVHFKDYDDLYGKGSMDFPKVRAALDAARYRGWCGIEGVKTPLGVEQSIRYDLDYLRPIFPRSV